MKKIKLTDGTEALVSSLLEVYIDHGQLKLDYFGEDMQTHTVSITERDLFRIKAVSEQSNEIEVVRTKSIFASKYDENGKPLKIKKI